MSAKSKPAPAPPKWGSKTGAQLAQALTTPKPPQQKPVAPRPVATAASTATAAAPSTAAAPAAAAAPVAAAAPAPVAAAPAPAPAAVEKPQEKTAPAAAEPETPSANGDATPSASTPAPDADGDATPPANAATPAPADGDDGEEVNVKSNGDDDTDTAASGTATGASAAGKATAAAGADGRNPLQCEWTMWYEVSKKGKTTSKSYAPERKKIMSFDTVEDFWCLWNNILKPSELSQKRTNNDKTDYLLFKSGVKPEWEDNKTGGQWELKLGKNPADIDEQWELAALGLIGDQYDASDEVLGCAIRLRPKGSRLELWTRDSRLSDAVKEIGLQFKQIIQYESRITYASFAAMKNGESKPMLDL